MHINIAGLERRDIGETPPILSETPSLSAEAFSLNTVDPKISVISCSKNLGRFLEDTIVTIARQSYHDFEYIVIDGQSTDNTLEILKKYPQIKWISEKDSGYTEAFNKGLSMAKGKYIMQCAVSDGYLDVDWLKKCVDVLDRDPEVSLVWGFPRYLSENGKLGVVSYPHFHRKMAPQKKKWFLYWLQTAFWLPEGNFCVRKEIFSRCYPKDDCEREIEPYLEFNYNFNKMGYLAYHIPAIANFGRTHADQLGKRDQIKGLQDQQMKFYLNRVRQYRNDLILGRTYHTFVDGCHRPIARLPRYSAAVAYLTGIAKKLFFVDFLLSAMRRVVKKLLFR